MIRRMLKRNGGHSTSEAKIRGLEPSSNWSDALKAYLAQPLLSLSTPLDEIEFLALDFETTGLYANKDKVLSVGMVDLTVEHVEIASSEELLIGHGEFIKPETAKINGLTPQALAQGLTLEEGIDRLLDRAKGKVILAHSCNIERSFIQAFLDHRYQLNAFPAHFIDTLQIEKRYSYAGRTNSHSSYQLDDIRRHYKLPEYLSHSAASDALACAELFLAQFKKLKLNHMKSMNLGTIKS